MDGQHQSAVKLAIVSPVFNDWEGFGLLVDELERVFNGSGWAVSLVAVDDCSTDEAPDIPLGGAISRMEVVRLGMNVGHQRAIAVGLAFVATSEPVDLVAVMDSDGEDKPDDLKRLVMEAIEGRHEAVVAERRKRSEGLAFRLFWRVYKLMFELLTGQRIGFGNFSVLAWCSVRRLVHNPNIWNHYAASLIQSRLRIRYVPTTRGARYHGQSKMNFVSLITHGLGAIAVFGEAVFVRILLFSCALLGVSIAVSAAVVAIRLFGSIAIPGWATNVLGFALLLSFQAVMLPILVGFLLLNNRASMLSLPKDNALRLVDTATVSHPDERE
jgi:glycosyltransferase involved in cell wall biosynthesis